MNIYEMRMLLVDDGGVASAVFFSFIGTDSIQWIQTGERDKEIAAERRKKEENTCDVNKNKEMSKRYYNEQWTITFKMFSNKYWRRL